MRVRALALSAVVGVSAAGAASAQQDPQLPAIEYQRKWDFSAQLAGVYDSNVARTSRAAAVARGVEPEDYKLTPSLNASVVQPFGQQALFLDGSLGYDFHARNELLDRRRISAVGGATAQIGPCRPMAYGSYRALQSDLGDLDLGTVQNLQETGGAAVALSCAGSNRIRGLLSAQRLDVKNSADRAVIQDHTIESLSGALSYEAPSIVNASLIFNYANSEYPNRIIPGRPVGDGFWTQSYGLRLERRVGSRLKGGGSLTRTTVKREFAPPGSQVKFHVTSYSAELSYQAGTRLLLELLGAREVKPSDRPGKLYDISETLEARGRYKLGSRFTVTLGHLYSDVASNADTALARSVITNARTNTSYGSFQYRQGGRGTLLLDVRREDRETNLPVFNYVATRVSVTTAVNF